MEKDLVSIITPLYNSEKFIEETYESIKKQTYEKWEWIVIDDCSNDESFNILKKLQKNDDRIRILKNKVNLKAAKSRNKGLDISKGEYITFIDSDDLWDNDFLEKQIKILNAKEINIIFSSYRRYSEDLSVSIDNYIVPSKITYNELLKENYMSCLTVLFRKKQFEKIRFNEKLKMHEDFVLWLEILEKEKIIFGNQEILATYRIRNNSISRNKIKNLLYMFFIIKNIKKFNLLKTFIIVLTYSYFGLKKNRRILINKIEKR